MTIKEFARLCACNAQTLRYYDRIGLLRPDRVDPASGYRHYDPGQALDFVKIKNLQAADFSIQEIKTLLTQPDGLVYEAFDRKILEQSRKLERIREIQRAYLAEKSTMEQIIHSMTDYLLSQRAHPEVLTELGLSPGEAPGILAHVRHYMNHVIRRDITPEQVSMTVNEEVVQGPAAVLDRIQSLTKENLTDTICLNDGLGQSAEHSTEPQPDLDGYDTLWEQRGWAHIRDFFHRIPLLEPGREYCLWARTETAAAFDDLSFPIFLMGSILRRQPDHDIVLNCAVTTVESSENHFKLLRKKAAP